MNGDGGTLTPKNNERFFQNRDCPYFPCHDLGEEKFNCLFCYCPLYFLGEKCDGNFKRTGPMGTVKDCSNCAIPHQADNYDAILAIIRQNIAQFKNEDGK